jgi:hypothetical protein
MIQTTISLVLSIPSSPHRINIQNYYRNALLTSIVVPWDNGRTARGIHTERAVVVILAASKTCAVRTRLKEFDIMVVAVIIYK